MAWSSASGALLERDTEFAQLRAAASRTAEGHGGVVVIEGPAGIGKTRLLREINGLAAEAELAMMWAKGSELEREYGFGVLRQLFEPIVMSPDGLVREELFKGAAALAAPLFQSAADSEVSALEPDYATLHGLYWLLAALADEWPLAVCVDDVQWADSPSLRFLSFATRRIESLPITIFATLRTGEEGSDPDLVAELTTEAGVLTLRPRSLSARGVAALAREELASEPSGDLVEACLESTGGNPFYLKALLAELEGAGGDVGPEAVRRVTEVGSGQISALLLRRLDALPAGAKELARAVAVLGDGTQLELAGRLAELEPMEAEQVLQSLTDARLLTNEGGLGFAHPIVRSSVYASLGPGTRSNLHVRAARELEQAGARVEEVAAHLLHAEPEAVSDAVTTLRAAAERALAVGAPESASDFLRRSLLEPLESDVQAEILLELGRAEVRAGIPTAVDHLERVVAHAAASPAQRGAAALDLGELFMHALRGDEAIPVLEAGLAATMESEPFLAKRIEATLIFNAFGHLAPRRQLLGRLRALRPPTDTSETDPIRLLFGALAYDQVAGAGTASDALSFAYQCLSYSGPVQGSTEGTAMSLALCGVAGADRPAEAEEHADKMLALARASGSITIFSKASALRALVRRRRGNLAGAEADARAVLALEADPSLEVVRPLVVAVIVTALTARDELAAAEAVAETIDRKQVVDVPTCQSLRESLVDLKLAQGEAEQAVEVANEFPAFEAEWGAGPGVGLYEWRWRAATAHAQAGDQETARAVAQEQMSLAESFGSERARGVALRTLAVLNSEPERIEMLRDAVHLLPAERSALERIQALVELGAALRRAGHRMEAREPLQEALALVRDCGALRLAGRAHTELRAAGARPRSPLRTGLDALTPSERRVAEMVANGLSNADTAQALFVTVKTVEMHLSNVYRKLNIGARTELREALVV